VRIILKLIFQELRWDAVGWVDLAQDGDKWRTFLNTVMNLRVQ
jgi:hypothetical protein